VLCCHVTSSPGENGRKFPFVAFVFALGCVQVLLAILLPLQSTVGIASGLPSRGLFSGDRESLPDFRGVQKRSVFEWIHKGILVPSFIHLGGIRPGGLNTI